MKDAHRISTAVSHLESSVRQTGYGVVRDRSPRSFAEATVALRGSSGLAPPFDPNLNDIDESDFFWLSARTGDGAIAALVAMRRERIAGTLAEHLDVENQRFYGNASVRVVGHAPAAHGMTGHLSYHGGLFVDPRYRRSGVGRALARLSIMDAHALWRPNYVWGYVADHGVRSGYASGIGYWNMQPHGTLYSAPPRGISETDWLVWMSGADLNDWAAVLHAGHGDRRPVVAD